MNSSEYPEKSAHGGAMICLELEVSGTVSGSAGVDDDGESLAGPAVYLDGMFSGCGSRWG